MSEVNFVVQLLHKLDFNGLKHCKSVLDTLVNKASFVRAKEVQSKDPRDYIDYDPSFMSPDSAPYGIISGEVESLGFKKNAGQPQTKWITATGQSYSWSSNDGQRVTTKEPIDIASVPGIKSLMEDLNTIRGTKYNSCLVCYYHDGQSFSSYHDDDEDCFEPNSSIAVVSFGVDRTVEFVRQPGYSSSDTRPLYSLKPGDGSIYTMKPGCQEFFQHGVKRDLRVKKPRFCLSFREMVTPDTKQAQSNLVSSPIKELIQKFNEGRVPAGPCFSTKPVEVLSDPPTKPPNTHHTKRNTTVLIGTSITSKHRIKNHQIVTRGKKFINLSESGAKIRDIRDTLHLFFNNQVDNSKEAVNVEKIIFSFGTNDIKYSRRGVWHLRKYVSDVLRDAKNMFPESIIIVQCCLPILELYWYTVPNVIKFNQMLSQICSELNCIYMDCFRDFITCDGRRNNNLFYDWLHLNDVGLGILCYWLKFIVSQSSFNHVLSNIPLSYNRGRGRALY